MLDRIISLFRPPRRVVMARFNAASRSDESQRNFSGTDFLSADAAMSQDVRRLIRRPGPERNLPTTVLPRHRFQPWPTTPVGTGPRSASKIPRRQDHS